MMTKNIYIRKPSKIRRQDGDKSSGSIFGRSDYQNVAEVLSLTGAIAT